MKTLQSDYSVPLPRYETWISRIHNKNANHYIATLGIISWCWRLKIFHIYNKFSPTQLNHSLIPYFHNKYVGLHMIAFKEINRAVVEWGWGGS
jgi:hypothetical protein